MLLQVAVLPGLRFPIPSSRDAYRDRLVEYFPSEVRGIDRYVRLLKEVNHIAEWMEARKDQGRKTNPLQLLWNIAAHGRLLPRYQNASIADVLDDCTQDPMLRAVLLTQTGDYGVPPQPCLCAAALRPGQPLLQGGLLPPRWRTDHRRQAV